MPTPSILEERNPKKTRRRIFVFAGLLLACLACLWTNTATHGAFAGTNGKIAFNSRMSGNEEIYIMNPDGTGLVQFTNDPGSDFLPKWSPDGSKILWHSDRTGDLEVFVANADGSQATNLTNNPATDGSPSWSPDGLKILFNSTRDNGGTAYDCYVMNADGSSVSRLTNAGGNYQSGCFEPQMSPDGTRITFWSDRDHDGTWDIYIMNADGTNITQLTFNSVDDYEAKWSPDGTKLLFWSGVGDAHSIYVMNPDGSNLISLTDGSADDTAPAWSPDGTQIVFASNRPGQYGICFMTATGSNIVCRTNSLDGGPDWGTSPADNTPTGSPTVQLTDANTGTAISLSFDNVSAAGDTGVTSTSSGPPVPANFTVDNNIFYNLTTTAAFSGSITVCIVGSGELLHFESNVWVDVTSAGYPTANITCGTVTSLSPFVIAHSRYTATIQPPINPAGTTVFPANRGTVPVKFKLSLNGITTCQLPQATIALSRVSGTTALPVNQSEFMAPSDTGINFRVDSANCQYLYNLQTKSLSPGTYLTQIRISGIAVGKVMFGVN